MKKFQVALTSLFVALLCMTTAVCAQGQTTIHDLIPKSHKHHHHHHSDTSDSSSSDSSSSMSEGPRGHRGRRGHRGHRGRKGSAGTAIAGRTGPPGIPGIQGIPGVGGSITSFISAFEVAGGTVVPLGTDILWSTNSPAGNQHIVSQTANFSLNTATGVFTSTAGAGNYEVFYGALWSGAAPFQLFVNGVAVPGSILNPPDDDFASMSIIVNVANANPTFEIRNISGTTAANLNPGATNLTTGAFITIKKIS